MARRRAPSKTSSSSRLTCSSLLADVLPGHERRMLAADSAEVSGARRRRPRSKRRKKRPTEWHVGDLRVLGSIERAVGSTLYSLTRSRRRPLSALKRREVRLHEFRGALQIGELAIPVWSWRKVVGSHPRWWPSRRRRR